MRNATTIMTLAVASDHISQALSHVYTFPQWYKPYKSYKTILPFQIKPHDALCTYHSLRSYAFWFSSMTISYLVHIKSSDNNYLNFLTLLETIKADPCMCFDWPRWWPILVLWTYDNSIRSIIDSPNLPTRSAPTKRKTSLLWRPRCVATLRHWRYTPSVQWLSGNLDWAACGMQSWATSISLSWATT